MTEFAYAGVAEQVRKTIVNELCGTHFPEKRLSHINEIDSLAGDAALLELTRMQALHYINVRSMFTHIVMYQESLVILVKAINRIVDP